MHETQSIDKFNYGLADRGASVRVPHSFVNSGYRGYLEDRRPNSLGDPYKIAGRILETIGTVPTIGLGGRGGAAELERKRRPAPRSGARRDLAAADRWSRAAGCAAPRRTVAATRVAADLTERVVCLRSSGASL